MNSYEALRRYGKHKKHCGVKSLRARKCDCGYEAALDAARLPDSHPPLTWAYEDGWTHSQFEAVGTDRIRGHWAEDDNYYDIIVPHQLQEAILDALRYYGGQVARSKK